jgi:hypothetical protein
VSVVVLIACVVADRGQSAGDEKLPAAITKWEYTSTREGIEDWNRLGKEGWELVDTQDTAGFFKRPKR